MEYYETIIDIDEEITGVADGETTVVMVENTGVATSNNVYST